MNIELEVCIDNLESLHLAIEGGATRIELCSSLALGGLTPSYGFMKQAAKHSTVPIYAMIRPRQGDFLFSEQDMQIMLEDVRSAKQAGLQGVVIGLLQPNGEIDKPNCQKLINEAHGMGVTFHRAIDQCSNAKQALEDIIDLGCERVLTSGLAANAYQGMSTIADMIQQAQGRISIMAGAGITPNNVKAIIDNTGVREIHLSGKSTRPSLMQSQLSSAKMGHNDIDDFAIPVTSKNIIHAVKASIQ